MLVEFNSEVRSIAPKVGSTEFTDIVFVMIGVCIDTCVIYQSVLEKKTYELQISDSYINHHGSSQIIHGWKEEILSFKMDLNST